MTISFLAAFLGGLLSLLSPCSALVLPSFFATSFHQTKKLILATLIFSLGILSVIIPLSLGLYTLINQLNKYRHLIIQIIGIFLLISGVLELVGKSLVKNKLLLKSSDRVSLAQAYFMGAIAGLGTTTCIGPIFGAILTLAASSATKSTAILLVISYSLGIILPLIIFALLWDRYNHFLVKILHGKVITFGKHKIHSINFIAGIMLITLGYVFMFYQGNLLHVPCLKSLHHSSFTFDLQDYLFEL